MSSRSTERMSAETRFRQAFERLKTGQPEVQERGTPVTQNNVAREAGCDPSALRKSRFPMLIREIQAYVELHRDDHSASGKIAQKLRASRRSTEERLKDAIAQRDRAQSTLVSANVRIIELTEQVRSLQRRVDELCPSPTKLVR